MDNNIEMRFCEVRAEGRSLSGTAVRYGDVASFAWGRERIEPGAFAPLGDAILNAQHDRATPLARTDGGGLTLLDSEAALEIRAELPPTRSADDVLELVRAKVMRGLSIEFVALTERSETDLRIIERARLVGIGVVDTPAYPASAIEARRAAAARRRPGRRRRVWL